MRNFWNNGIWGFHFLVFHEDPLCFCDLRLVTTFLGMVRATFLPLSCASTDIIVWTSTMLCLCGLTVRANNALVKQQEALFPSFSVLLPLLGGTLLGGRGIM